MAPGKLILSVTLSLGLLIGGCSPVPAATQDEVHTPTAPVQEAEPSSTPEPGPTAGLNRETVVVFTIANDEPAGGVSGEPAPDWLAWGAPAFTLAPDGSFWILDTAAAHPPRLLRFDPHGVSQAEIALEGQIAGAVDVAVAGDAIWVLGIATQPAQVAAFDLSGRLLETYPIPESLFEFQGDYASNMLDDLRVGAAGELLLKGPVGPVLYELLDASGEMTARQLEGYTLAGHVYRVEPPGLVNVDDRAIEISPATPGGRVLEVDLLGVRTDGGFYAAVMEEQVLNGQTNGYLRVVHAYALNGDDLGVSLAPGSPIWVESNRDLAVGPDGSVYALVSREDHSVDVLRLGFTPELPLPQEPVFTPAASPAPLSPLLPAWATPPAGASDLEVARNALLAFFSYLHDGRYTEAAALYGGPLEAVAGPDPDSPPDDPGRFWEEACFLLQCLQVAAVVEEEQIAPDEFRFLIEFMWDDGTLFVLGPCCGASEADMPPVWRFPYTVRLVEGRFVVMEPPQYIP